MTEQAGYDWSGLWQAWARLGSGAWAETLRNTGTSPVEAAVAAYQRFADTVATSLDGVAPAEQAARLAAACEALAATWDGQDRSRWFAAPFAFAAAGGDDGTLRGVLAACDTVDAWSRELLALPALGPQREWQAAGRRLVEAQLAERAAVRHLLGHHVTAVRAALRAFAGFLRDEDGPPLNTLRALYDAWIGIADETWRETMMSAAYGRDFGGWVNRASELRAAWAALDERFAGLSGRPTRAAFDALLARQQALEAEIEALRAARTVTERASTAAAGSPQDAGVVTTPVPSPDAVGNTPRKPASPRGTQSARREAPAPRTSRRARSNSTKVRAAAREAGRPVRKGTRTPVAEFDIANIFDDGD
ncbi:MAG: poly(R)-hydroxyalkanoic acid synthase subunit PhaE [Gammaproteobacteria bacterium]